MDRTARYQNYLPLILLGLGIGFTFLVGLRFNASTPYSFFLPGIIVLSSFGVLLLANEHVRIGLVFLLFVVSLGGEGIGLSELLLGVYSVLFLAIWFFERIIARKTIFESKADLALGAFIAICLMGAVIGLLNSAVLTQLAAELFSFCLLLFYFPLREYCRRHENGARNLVYMLIACGIYAAVANAFAFADLLARTLDPRGISGGRVVDREILLFFATISALLFLSLRSSLSKTLLTGMVFALCLAAAILTQFRAVYMGIAMGACVIFMFSDRLSRRKILLILVSGAAAALIGIYIVLGDIALLLIGGVVDRILSIGSASESDISFINRFFEYERVIELVMQSPIAGHGLGVNFSFYDAIYRFSWTKSFVHNAPLHLMYKVGILGFATFTYMLYRHVVDAWKGLRLHPERQEKQFATLKIAAILGLIVVGIFSVLFNTDTTFPLAAVLATHSLNNSQPLQTE